MIDLDREEASSQSSAGCRGGRKLGSECPWPQEPECGGGVGPAASSHFTAIISGFISVTHNSPIASKWGKIQHLRPGSISDITLLVCWVWSLYVWPVLWAAGLI